MKEKAQRFPRDYVQILFWVVLLLGILLRACWVGEVPNGLNQDEASMGYDAWSILHYGIDRNGTPLPVHMISWGCGQNALYAYLSMPFIALFGLTPLSIRLVSVILGSLTLPTVYFILKPFTSRRTALIGMGLLAIAPWHILLCRWGLEANILPALFSFAVLFLIKALKKPNYFILSSALFSLALYSYGPSYCVIPVFFCAAFFVFWFKVKLDLRRLLLGGASFVLLALPIGLFLLTNFFNLGDISIGPFTAPALTGQARLHTALSEGSLSGSFENFINNVLLQRDWTAWNTLQPYGVYYLISFPFTVLGLIRLWRKRTPLTYILSGWLASSLLLFVLMNGTNINRVNIVFIPLILLAAVGLNDVMGRDRKKIAALFLVYAVFFSCFLSDYVDQYARKPHPAFYANFGEAIQKAVEVADPEAPIYLTTEVNMPYIFVLFYTRTPPREFLETREISRYDVEFQPVASFGRYVFNTQPLEEPAPGVYVIPSYHSPSYASAYDEIYSMGKYDVLVVREMTEIPPE